MLKGSSPSVISENVRLLRAQGLSESDAISRANSLRVRESDDSGRQSGGSDLPAPTGRSRRFVVVTSDFSGLGWGLMLKQEGEDVVIATCCPEEDPKEVKIYQEVGEGLIDRVTLKQAVSTYTKPTDYWMFAENIEPQQADKLRSRGQKVFGTSVLSERMEHDRKYAVEIANKAGLKSPLTQECSSRKEGISFLQAHADQAFVFKPDNGGTNYSTFVPVRDDDADANQEVLTYLTQMTKEPGTYILQERVRGTEVNVEGWLYEGEPFFANTTLEAKRKNSGELGEMSGCAGDVVKVIPLDSKLVKDTVGKLFSFYKKSKYTGFADVNIILTDDGPRFLEVCNRCGYNGTVTLLLGLLKGRIGNLLADYMDGDVLDFESRFHSDWGGSLTLFLDHPRPGLPVHLDDSMKSSFYPFDGSEEEGDFLLRGYSHEVGIVVDHGRTPEEALMSCMKKVEEEHISFPDLYYRKDLAKGGYPNAIVTRAGSLEDEGWL